MHSLTLIGSTRFHDAVFVKLQESPRLLRKSAVNHRDTRFHQFLQEGSGWRVVLIKMNGSLCGGVASEGRTEEFLDFGSWEEAVVLLKAQKRHHDDSLNPQGRHSPRQILDCGRQQVVEPGANRG